MKYWIASDAGPRKVDGRKFAFDIGDMRHWFFASTNITPFRLVVSHVASGTRVCDASQSERQSCLGDEVAAAKMALKALIEKHGAPRVTVVLNSAPLLVLPAP